MGLPADDEATGAAHLAAKIRELARQIGQPTSLQEAGISPEDFEAKLPKLLENAQADFGLSLGLRFPDEEEAEQLFRYAFEGRSIDF